MVFEKVWNPVLCSYLVHSNNNPCLVTVNASLALRHKLI